MLKIGVVVAVTLLVFLVVTLGISSRKVKRLESLILDDYQQISKLKTQIELQNSQIAQFKVEAEFAKDNYEKELADINKKYRKKASGVKKKGCEETLEAIYNEQMSFINKE